MRVPDALAFVRLMVTNTLASGVCVNRARTGTGSSMLGDLLLTLAEYLNKARRPAARAAIMAALKARNAAIEGDAQTVDAFSRDWLGLSDPVGWRTAVENALLGDWVDHLGRGVLRDPDLAKLLRLHSKIEHRYLQPLWERKVHDRRLRLLQDPVANGLLLADLLTDHQRPEDVVLAAELADSRLSAVLRGLAPQEAEVALVWASDQSATWRQAAAAVGHPDPEAFGNRVRRKLKSLGTRHTHRAQQAAGTRAGSR
ncbi:hypothetical protein [Kitasatospora kifunensis]|uniref:Uncharacterized protein n=1 Tax=Kitasatospora kifunensis TaxID=58351 RepID=A0A7W7RAK3_KITKI|nr:hypothetical protein [Kitasatospora kifunensis]MBB4928389.1 hypothetical protein [Kitasatospora kifunensis]